MSHQAVPGAGDAPPSALVRFDQIREALPSRCLACFLDYDGTLTPIVSHPDLARLSDEMRATIETLAQRCTVAVISGRGLDDVRRQVGIDTIFYAGSHGFEMAGPGGWHAEQEGAVRALPALDRAEAELRERVASVPGAWVERKRFGVAVHYRQSPESETPALERHVAETAQRYRDLRRAAGKKVFELQPDVAWDKGAAVRSLLEKLRLDRAGALPLYIGDDITDEDAFHAVASTGIGIAVLDEGRPTAARYALRDPAEVARFLGALTHEID